MRLTEAQRALLRELPDAPSDSMLCKGPRYRVAEALVRLGLARLVGARTWNGGRSYGAGGYYVRTADGRLRAEKAKAEEGV